MYLDWLQRHGLVAATLLVSVTILRAALPTPAQAPASASLAGQLLIASTTMSDPRFVRTVVLIVRHDQNGAFGIVVNRPVEERPLASVLEALGDKDAAIEGSVRIFAGGPVQPEIGFVVHSADYHRTLTIDIDGHVAMTSSREILRDIGNKQGPRKSLIAFGYAGWAPGQLENEIRQRAWFTAPEDDNLVFDDDRAKVWDDAMAHRTQDL
jgi:putative transcriptional regulator